MAGDDSKTGSEKPSEQRGGTVPGEQEAREKGPWAGTSGDGIVPAELGGSDAPPEMLEDAPGMGDAALGRTTGSNEPATDGGIDPAAGDGADATTLRRPRAAGGRRGRHEGRRAGRDQARRRGERLTRRLSRARAARRTRCAASAGTCRPAARAAAPSRPRRAAPRSARASSGCRRRRRSACGAVSMIRRTIFADRPARGGSTTSTSGRPAFSTSSRSARRTSPA